ncbi:hypothetical protein [Ekhidna sp.]|uniref:hypothetical protein n=1 Tax=Ekhidna sp. TaxID=2608089 RepID=UPI0032EE39EB
MQWADGVKKIVYVPPGRLPSGTPASVSRAKGIIFIDREVWKRLTPDQRFFLLLHEAGHLRLKSRNEKEVDDWAFREYAKRGYRLSQSIYALTRLLNYDNPEHLERTLLQIARAKHYDRTVNGNTRV